MLESVFGKGTRTHIVEIVSEHQPIRIKKIYVKVNKLDSLSYQAVHKVVKQLESEHVLLKKANEYEINPKWIETIKQASAELENSCNKAVREYDINPNFTKPINLKFDDLGSLSVFCAEICTKQKIVGKGNPMVVVWLRHLYIPLNLNFRDYSLIKEMASTCGKVFMMSPGNSPLDKWVKEQYLNAGFTKVKLGVTEPIFDDGFFVQGDSYAEITSSKETKKIIDKIYNRNHNLGDLFKEVFFRKEVKQKLEFNIKITKDPKVAEMLRNQLLMSFK